MLGFLSVCGVATRDAPDVLRAYVDRMRGRDAVIGSRIALYHGLVTDLQAHHAIEDSRVAVSTPYDMRCHTFEAFSWDLKAALFMLMVLGFSAREAAEILQVDPDCLAMRLEGATQLFCRCTSTTAPHLLVEAI